MKAKVRTFLQLPKEGGNKIELTREIVEDVTKTYIRYVRCT